MMMRLAFRAKNIFLAAGASSTPIRPPDIARMLKYSYSLDALSASRRLAAAHAHVATPHVRAAPKCVSPVL